MQFLKTLRIACTAALLTGALAPAIAAQDLNSRDRTYLTFSAPIQVPGRTLGAGKYLFQLMDSPGNRHIVQVFNAQGTQLYATLMAIPDQRLRPYEKTTITFIETPASRPYAIRSWFYPGRTVGHEFMYPKSQAIEIAKATHQPVLASDGSSVSAVQPAQARPSADSGAMSEAQNRPAPAADTQAQASQSAATNQTPPPATDGQLTPETAPKSDQQLPNTASNLPLVFIGGLMALGVALLVRTIRFVIW